MNTNKTLVVYFSAEGTTAQIAKQLAEAIQAELFEIKPVTKYTKADLNWNDQHSRSSIEMNDPASRPAIAEKITDIAQYDTILIGFPIWWYTAPRIISTFLESYDFSHCTMIPFATSGGSPLGNTVADLEKVCPHAKAWKEGKLLNHATKETIEAWVKTIKQ